MKRGSSGGDGGGVASRADGQTCGGGEAQIAKRQAVVNPENTFFSVKRFIGARMDEVTDADKQLPYSVVKGDTGNIKIDCPAAGKSFAAEEISAQVSNKRGADYRRNTGEKCTAGFVKADDAVVRRLCLTWRVRGAFLVGAFCRCFAS
jgi:hypothetical protein